MGKTADNLSEAFAGESQANRKYLAFAKKADEEGQPQVAKLFRAAAAAETVHAMNHLKAMDGIGDTIKNLKHAIEGEMYETITMYPDFAKVAEAEGNTDAAVLFKQIAKIEKEHKERYEKLLKRVEDGTVYKREKPIRWKCMKCGYVHEGTEPPMKCPSCKHPREYYEPEDIDL